MAWQIDPAHSTVGFSVRHMVVSTVHGRFKVFDGTIEIDDANPANSSIEAHAETASIDTSDENRNNHLRSADFFDAEKYPTITFKSTKVEPTGDNTYQVTASALKPKQRSIAAIGASPGDPSSKQAAPWSVTKYA